MAPSGVRTQSRSFNSPRSYQWAMEAVEQCSRYCFAYARQGASPIVSADFVYYICVSESDLVRIELRIALSTAQGLTIGPWKLLNVGRSCGFLYNEHGQICANIWSDLSSMPIRARKFSSAQLSPKATDACRRHATSIW